MCSERTILTLQFIATFLMAFDYFFDDNQRKEINAAVRSVIQPVQDSIDKDLGERLGYIVQQWAYIVVSLLFVLLGWLGIQVLPMVAPSAYPWVTPVLALLLLGLFAGGAPRLLTVLIGAVAPIFLGGAFRTITSFLIRCHKGTVFGVGFVILMMAFACRFSNLPQ